MSDEATRFESWGILEIMGHSRFAGLISEQTIGGVHFVRIDVPEVPPDQHRHGRPGFTKFFTQSAIFSLTPTAEEIARRAAAEFRTRPITMFDVPTEPRLTAAAVAPDDEEESGVYYGDGDDDEWSET